MLNLRVVNAKFYLAISSKNNLSIAGQETENN